jgi:hypothetical protein
MSYYQHGDVLLKEAELPKEAKKVKTNVLHKGLNHTHNLTGKFQVYSCEQDIYLVSSGCNVVHGEHKPIAILKGVYKKSIVVEYDHFKEESREVID